MENRTNHEWKQKGMGCLNRRNWEVFLAHIVHIYKKVVNSQEDLWVEYCRLQKEVKQFFIKKKLNTVELD